MSIEEDLGAIEGAAKRLLHIGQQQAAPAPAPVPTFTPRQSSQQSQPEVPVSQLASDFHRWAAVAEAFGEDALGILEAVASNAETIALTVAGARIAHLPLTPGTITGAAHAVQAIEQTWKDAHAPQRPSGAADVGQQQADGTDEQASA